MEYNELYDGNERRVRQVVVAPFFSGVLFGLGFFGAYLLCNFKPVKLLAQ
jgi:hypothetical protein